MSKQPSVPLVHAFVVCREVFEDARTHHFILIDPRSEFVVPAFPGPIRFAVYAHLTGLHGQYFPEFRLEDSDAEIAWSHRAPRPISQGDPIHPHRFVYYDVTIDVPAPGRYDLVLLARGTEIARHALWVRAPRPSGGEPASE